ncbi:conserved hypothetical protein [Methanocaldococcus vulcanius M7]|uniref:Uncharacterized protein n=1 Tax=Methanocaldococcus vulcanius (strain ATCC 700851 / DSM 12094 / M7) TaxID=579137 RepID=C9RFL5_METVM|nr:hypothetical protein [Methanocaldococcus vulcanius]ACX72367.1 conserved hypothetical protein [Methanocaldococcus vulcanius M7]
MVEMNKKSQFFIIGAVILSIGLILFFLLGFSSNISDNSYLMAFKMKDVKNSIKMCLISSLNSNSNLSKNLYILKNNYKDEGVEINYRKILSSTIAYEAKNLTFNFLLNNGTFFYNASNYGFGGAFNGSLNISNYQFKDNIPIYIPNNNSITGICNITGNYTNVFVYDNFGNLVVNKTIYNSSNISYVHLYYCILNVSKEGNFVIFIMAKYAFNNSLMENISCVNASGYFDSYTNNTYVSISINGSFSGMMYVKSQYKNYSTTINKSENFIFNDTKPPIYIILLNNYSDVLFIHKLNETINNFTDTSYIILNNSCKNNYFNVIYGNPPTLYVSLHDGNFCHNITIYAPQKGISSKGLVLADILITNPRMFYSSSNNLFEYQSWNIN